MERSYLNSVHCIMDIETLGVQHNSVVMSCGLVFMTGTGEILDVCYHTFDTSIQERHQDNSTIMFWASQKESILDIAKSEKYNIPVKDFTKLFQSKIEKYKVDYFWGCSPDFDYAIMKDFMGTALWKFWQLRDIRTIRNFLSDETLSEIDNSVETVSEYDMTDSFLPHNALYDALHESKILLTVLMGGHVNGTKE